MESSCTALLLPLAFRGATPAELEGTTTLCGGGITEFAFAGSEVTEFTFQLVARRSDGSETPAGRYRLRTNFQAPIPNMDVEFDIL